MVTKDEIAATFLHLLERYGYRRTTIDDVAARCRISKKTVYAHFADKADLFEYALTLWAERQRASVEARLTASGPAERLAQWVGFAFADAHAAALPGRPADADGPTDIVDHVNERVFVPVLAGLLADGDAQGAWSVPHPELTARFCVAIGVEGVRALLADPAVDTEAATLAAIRRLVGLSS